MLADEIAALLPRMRRFARALTYHRDDADDLAVQPVDDRFRRPGGSHKPDQKLRFLAGKAGLCRCRYVGEVRRALF